MKVGIYHTEDPNGKYLSCNLAYEKILAHNGIQFLRLRAEDPDFWEEIRDLDLFIIRWKHIDTHRQLVQDILPAVETQLGIRCFPDLNTCQHYDDKVKQYLLLKPLGFPMVKSYIFWDRKEALKWVKGADYPLIFKLRGGAGSLNVIMIKNQRQARKLVKRMFGRGIYPEKFFHAGSVRFQHFNLKRELHHIGGNLYRRSRGLDASPFWRVHKNYILFQEFLPGNKFDTRVTVIGDRAFVYRRMVRQDDFRASGSGLNDYDTGKIDMRCVKIAFEISHALKFKSMAYDFLFDREDQPQFCEISYTFVSRYIFKCPGYFDPQLQWHHGHFWPEYLHLIDALELPDLRQPELDY